MSPHTTPADFDGDGVVNGRDLAVFLTAGRSANDFADFNDGLVDAQDRQVIIAARRPCGECAERILKHETNPHPVRTRGVVSTTVR